MTAEDLKIKLCIYAFDLLYLNGKPLINEDLVTRRAQLHSSFEAKKGEFHFASHWDPSTPTSNLPRIHVAPGRPFGARGGVTLRL